MIRFFLGCLLIGGLVSCGPAALETDAIYGEWEINGAKRNGKETQTLDGAFFKFYEDNSMLTNMMGQEQSVPFTIDESSQEIIQEGSQGLRFKIDALQKDQLVLSTTIRNVPFELNLIPLGSLDSLDN